MVSSSPSTGVSHRRAYLKAEPDFSAFTLKPVFDSPGLRSRALELEARATLFGQGDPATNVMYIQEGGVKLCVVNESGKEGVVSILGPGDYLGEGSLAGRTTYAVTAITIVPSRVLVISKDEMKRQLRAEHEFSDRFIAYMLARNLRVESDLINQLVNSSEKRLARTLVVLARFGSPVERQKTLPRISQETLAEMVGTTRPRINLFMNKFKKLGFIEYDDVIRVNASLLSYVLRD